MEFAEKGWMSKDRFPISRARKFSLHFWTPQPRSLSQRVQVLIVDAYRLESHVVATPFRPKYLLKNTQSEHAFAVT